MDRRAAFEAFVSRTGSRLATEEAFLRAFDELERWYGSATDALGSLVDWYREASSEHLAGRPAYQIVELFQAPRAWVTLLAWSDSEEG